MLTVPQLKRAVADAIAYLRTVPDVQEAEVFMAANANLITRLAFTSHIPSNGVEEPKSNESFGVGLRVVFRDGGGIKQGFGSEPSDMTLAGVAQALDKARRGAVPDPEFVSLPRMGAKPRRSLIKYHDPALMKLDDAGLVDLGWRVVDGALEVFQSSEALLEWSRSPDTVKDLGLILTGDMMVIQERVAVGNTVEGAVIGDETALISSVATSMVERRNTKGTGWHVGGTLAGFGDGPGDDAARNAIRAADGVRIPEGEYRVVLGPQPVTDILNNLVLPGLSLGLFHAWASPFQGKLGKQIASRTLSMYDHGALRGLAASKGVTDEGLPTGRTDLIRHGRLVGLLANWYEHQRALHDPEGARKLGVDPNLYVAAIAPRNGFRFGMGGGRHFTQPPGIAATNVMVEGTEEVPTDELLRRVGDGIYIGRIWYTYPINGITQGDFTCTVIGDSYLIKDGRLGKPLQPNAVRLNDNTHRILNGIIGIGREKKPTVVWNADEIVHAPEIAIESVAINEVGDALMKGD
ncbi:MAG: TldD/PmbA family protein [SAR202 cluster bacterium]|nr:TldD/PmbA family protein [SAR202 cluster bacterium]